MGTDVKSALWSILLLVYSLEPAVSKFDKFPPEVSQLGIPEALSRAYRHWHAAQADQAEQLCQRVLAVWPGHAGALHQLGLMAHAYGNPNLALAHLRQACFALRAPALYFSNLAEMCCACWLRLYGLDGLPITTKQDVQ